MLCDELVGLPEIALAVFEDHPEDLPGAAVVDHDLQRGSRTCIGASLLEYSFWVWRVMDYAKGVDELVRLNRNEAGELLGVAVVEGDVIGQAEHGCSLLRDLDRLI